MIRMKYSLGLDTPPGKYPSDSEESPSGAVDADHAARGRSGRADAPPVQERVGSRLIEGDLGISGERRVGRQHPVPERRRVTLLREGPGHRILEPEGADACADQTLDRAAHAELRAEVSGERADIGALAADDSERQT